MIAKLKSVARAARIAVARAFRRPGATDPLFAEGAMQRMVSARRHFVIGVTLLVAGWLLATHPPVQSVGPGEVGVRTNQITGSVAQWRDGTVLVIPGVHAVQVFSLRDRMYKPQQTQAAGSAPVQSVEGLSVGIDMAVRYALDPDRIAATARNLPPNLDTEIVEPAVQGVVYKVFARYTVREIFSTKRGEIQQTLESDLRARLAADGVLLRSVLVARWTCRPTTSAAWKACWPRNWKLRRCATRWS